MAAQITTDILENEAEITLYQKDYHLWVETTVRQIQAGHFEAVDWENLIEEVADLSRRQRDKLKSLLTRLFEHLLKLTYWQAERDYNARHWQGEIVNFRCQIQDLLEESPSLKPFLAETLPKCYKNARKITIAKTGLPASTFPDVPIATVGQILNDDWLPSR
jgi:hypothetical protein